MTVSGITTVYIFGQALMFDGLRLRDDFSRSPHCKFKCSGEIVTIDLRTYR